jgi:hypothetical protein
MCNRQHRFVYGLDEWCYELRIYDCHLRVWCHTYNMLWASNKLVVRWQLDDNTKRSTRHVVPRSREAAHADGVHCVSLNTSSDEGEIYCLLSGGWEQCWRIRQQEQSCPRFTFTAANDVNSAVFFLQSGTRTVEKNLDHFYMKTRTHI